MEPVCVTGSVDPSPIMISSLSVYGEWRDRLSKSAVTWWETPLSNNHGCVLLLLVATLAWGVHELVGGKEFGVVLWWMGMRR